MNLKKPKFWEYNKPNLISYFLLALSSLLNFIQSIRKRSKPKNFKIQTICVGNIYIGGTGKTSLSIKINEILDRHNIKSCFIKKFYPDQKDEQKILSNKGKLFLDSKRVDAVNQAIDENYEIAILDDGLQDYSIKYDNTFVCFNNLNWIGNGLSIPAGPLRENINNLKNYQHIFLNGNLENIEVIKRYLLSINSKIFLLMAIDFFCSASLSMLILDDKYNCRISFLFNGNLFVYFFKDLL